MKFDTEAELKYAHRFTDPWYLAQDLARVARYTEEDPLPIAARAAKAALECKDDYQRSAVRAWEIAALAQRGHAAQARASLDEALAAASTATPVSSRSEALMLLLHAAFWIGRDEALKVYEQMKATCPAEEHWRCKRNLRDGERMISGVTKPRQFYGEK